MTSDGFQGDVYESSTTITSSPDELCSLIDEGYWHENDLILAAELGKALLARNRKLELALEKSKELEQKKQAEIEFLTKEIAHIREVSQEKMAFVDEADRYNQELDQTNRKLLRERVEDKRKIRRLLNTISALEEQVADLSEQLSRRNLYLESTRTSNREPQTTVYKAPGPVENTDPISIYHPRTSDRLRFYRPSKPARDHFIDDDFLDQPELGAYLAPKFNVTEQLEPSHLARRISNNGNYTNSSIHQNSYHYQTELHRCLSWPQLVNRIPINLRFELETSDQNTRSKNDESNLRPIDKKAEELNNFYDPDAGDLEQSPVVGDNSTDAENSTSPGLGQVPESTRSNTPINPNNQSKDSGIQSSFENVPPSNLNPAQPPDKSHHHHHSRLADEIEDLLDDVSFLNCLDRIYNPHIRSQYSDLIKEDYKPRYKQLFHEAFQLLNHMRNTKLVELNSSH